MPALRQIAPKLLEDAKEGYDFTDCRWEGEEYLANVQVMRAYLLRSFKYVGVSTGETTRWDKGKKYEFKTYKLYLGHPKDDDLHAWWTPTRETWVGPVNVALLTWFEYQTKAA